MARPWSARCYGVARQREGPRQNSIGFPRVNPTPHPYTRARALMARPWSARCYGVARQREGSRQNSIGAPACSLSGILGWFSLSLGAWVPKNLARRNMEVWLRRRRRRFSFSDFRFEAAAATLSGTGSASPRPLARGCRRIWRGEIWKYGFGGAVADLVLVISGS